MKSQPCDAVMASRILSRQEASVGIFAHGTSAPAARLLARSGTTRSGSISRRVPRPVQDGHAPCGELNENVRGSSSSTVNPSYGQLYFSLYRCSSNAAGSSSRGAGAISTTPSPSRSAVSIESASRPASGSGIAKPGLRVDRSAVGRERCAVGGFRMAHDVPVDDDLDRMPLVLVELRGFGDVHHLPVDADADEALPACGVEDAVTLGLAVLDERAQDQEARALRQREDLVHDLLDGLPLDRMAVGAVRDPDPREQQPQVVVDLGDRPDRGPRVPRRALLVDGDRRRQAVDLVDVRLLHLSQELPGVGAEALDVAALALGVDRVEGEAALARSRQARDDDEAVARERDVDVLEVVFARSAHDESVLGHVRSVRHPGGIEHPFSSTAGPCRARDAGLGGGQPPR